VNVRRIAVAVTLTCGVTLPGSAAAAFPGHNGRIVFDNGSSVFSVRPDGSGLRRITAGTRPDVAPDGRRVTFGDSRSGNQRGAIYSARLSGAARHRLTNFDLNTSPAFSGPLGRRIAFTQYGYHSSRLWVMRADGSEQTDLTPGPMTYAFNPAFSPDGEWVAFERRPHPGEATEIYKIRPDGTGQRRLTHTGPDSLAADFSPDGRWIAFNRLDRQSEAGIFLMRPNGAHIHRITEKHSDTWDPAFSPNGKRIVYNDDDRDGLFTMRRDGAGSRRVTDSGGYSDWAPTR
jgi:TolB protein